MSIYPSQSSKYSHQRQMWDAIGMWAWILHRVTGLGLVFYILLHIILMGTSILSGKDRFNATLTLLMTHLIFEILDILLLGAVLYHGLNGIRILMFDMGIGVTVNTQRNIFRALMVAGALMWIWAIALKLSG
ncbi:MAG: succinate dehydrogenase, cytochrome b556 subunit [Desulfobacteraceae bacterium]|nr:MAG: succinate dehydrogenase, cytochrome b556 subunit [Desulfobacteraceae bacterium]